MFLFEERRALQKKRAKIRWLQLKRPADPVNFRDVPNRIPKSLSVGDHVTAYLYQSAEVQSGLYQGYNLLVASFADVRNTIQSYHRI